MKEREAEIFNYFLGAGIVFTSFFYAFPESANYFVAKLDHFCQDLCNSVSEKNAKPQITRLPDIKLSEYELALEERALKDLEREEKEALKKAEKTGKSVTNLSNKLYK